MAYPAANGACPVNANLHNALSGLKKAKIRYKKRLQANEYMCKQLLIK
jgi:hypothetical protein